MLPDEVSVVGLSRGARSCAYLWRHGFKLGPIMGGIVAQLALDGRTN